MLKYEQMLSPNQKVVLNTILENAKSATAPIDKKTLRRLLDQSDSIITEASLDECLRKLMHEGYLRAGIYPRNTYVVIRWE